MSNKITPMLRCESNASELATYYCDIFPGATITKTNPVVTTFEVCGQTLSTINGGPHPDGVINPSISFSLWIKDKEQTKVLWDKLSEGGTVLMPFDAYDRSPAYGRCNDKYGVSRQVMYDAVPEHTSDLLIPSLMYTGANSGKAQEAMELYTRIFPASSIEYVHPYPASGPDIEGDVAHAEFSLVHQKFIAMDSSLDHKFQFNDGVSLSVSCADQAEVDAYREALIADGGQEVQCGRCKDKYGVSRQIVPVQLPEALFQADAEKSKYAMQAMMGMKKIIIADLYQS